MGHLTTARTAFVAMLVLVVHRAASAASGDPFLDHFAFYPTAIRWLLVAAFCAFALRPVGEGAVGLAVRLATTIRSRLGAGATVGALALGFAALCWWLRSPRALGDAPALLRLIPAGYRFNPHSPLGKYLQHVWYDWSHAAFGWDAATSWGVTSVAFGGAFLALLLVHARAAERDPRRRLLLVGAVATMGSVQLFFGTVEDYALALLTSLAYFVAAHRYRRGRCGIELPSAALAIAIAASNVNGWLLPSLAFLWWIGPDDAEPTATARTRDALRAAAGFALPLAAGFALLLAAGARAADFWQQHHLFAAATGSTAYFYSLRELVSPAHLRNVALEAVLIAPLALVLLPHLGAGRLRGGWDRDAAFLAVASLGTFAFGFVWIPQLGAFEDWNLFATNALPWTLLAVHVYARTDDPAFAHTTGVLLAGSALLTASWILASTQPL